MLNSFNNASFYLQKIYNYLWQYNKYERVNNAEIICNNSILTINNKYSKKKFNFLIYLLRIYISKINKVYDIISLLKKISIYFFKNSQEVSTDNICFVIITCLNKYPITNIELQRFSIIQQTYDRELGIRNFASTLLWLCCIQSIQEREHTRLITS